MVLKLRHSLSDQSVRAATILGSWLRLGIPGILDKGELLETLRSKYKWPNNGKGKGKARATEPEGELDSDVQLVE